MENCTTEYSEIEDAEVLPHWVFIYACVLSASGVSVALVFLIFNTRYRKSRLIKMSSPNMNSITTLGAIMAYGTCLLFTIDVFILTDPDLTAMACQLRAWGLPVSMTLVFAPIFAKSWRVNQIFKKATVKRIVIKETKLLAVIFLFLMIDAVILGIWQLMDPLHTVKVIEQVRMYSYANSAAGSTRLMTYHNNHCTSRYTVLWMTSLHIYKTVLLLYGAYLSWCIRSIALPSMNESRCIILSCLATVICGNLVSMSSYWLRHHHPVSRVFLVTCIFGCTTAVLGLLYIPKIILWWRNEDNDVIKTANMTSSAAALDSMEIVEDNLYHVIAENDMLKKSLKEKDNQICSLHMHIQNARGKMVKLVSATMDDRDFARGRVLKPLSPSADDRQDSGLDPDLSSCGYPEDENAPRIKLLRSNSIGSGVYAQRRYSPIKSQLTSHDKSNTLPALNYIGQQNVNTPALLPLETGDFGRKSQQTSQNDIKGNRVPMQVQRESQSGIDQHQRSTMRNRQMSASRVTSVHQDGRLKHTIGDITQDLENADSLSLNLRNSIAKDLRDYRIQMYTSGSAEPSKQTTVAPPTRGEIADSLVQSLALDDNSDTFSYISAKISNTTGGVRVLREIPADLDDLDSIGQNSLEAGSSSDESQASQEQSNNGSPKQPVKLKRRPKRDKHGKRSTGSRKRNSRPRIYVIQVPIGQPNFTTSIPITENAQEDGTVV